jgi:hypothetical protein
VLEALSSIAHRCEAQGGAEESRGGRAGSEEAKQGLTLMTAQGRQWIMMASARGQRRAEHGVERVAGGARASGAWPVAVAHTRAGNR